MWAEGMHISKDALTGSGLDDTISLVLKELARQFRFKRINDFIPENTRFQVMVKFVGKNADITEKTGDVIVQARIGSVDEIPGPQDDSYWTKLFAEEAWKPRIKRPEERIAEYEALTGEKFDARP